MLRLLSQDLVRSGFVRTPDDVHLYWRAVGHGPLLVCCNGVGVSTFFWKYIVERFRDRYTVVVWDYRGHGRSDRKLDPTTTDLSVARHADDLMLVMDAVRGGGDPAVLFGHSMGCQVVLEAWRRHPERVRGLVLMQGTAGHVLDTFFNLSQASQGFRAIRRLAMKGGRATTAIIRPLLEAPLAVLIGLKTNMMDSHYTAPEDLRNYLEHLARMDLRVFLGCVWEAQRHSAWEALPQVDVPTLVVAADGDTFTPVACGRKIADLIPGAELLVLGGATHAALVEQPQTVNHRVERFLQERLRGPPPPRSAEDAVSGPQLANVAK